MRLDRVKSPEMAWYGQPVGNESSSTISSLPFGFAEQFDIASGEVLRTNVYNVYCYDQSSGIGAVIVNISTDTSPAWQEVRSEAMLHSVNTFKLERSACHPSFFATTTPKARHISWKEPESSTALLAQVPANEAVWIGEVVRLDKEGDHYGALLEITRASEEAKLTERFSGYSHDLLTFNLSVLSDVVILGLLRNSFAFRSELKGWPMLVKNASHVLENRGQNVKRLLRGIVDGAGLK